MEVQLSLIVALYRRLLASSRSLLAAWYCCAAGTTRRSDGAGASQAQQRQPVDQEANKAARRQAQLEKRKKAAARNASMFDESATDSGADAFAPVKPAAVAKPGRGSLSQKLGVTLFPPYRPADMSSCDKVCLTELHSVPIMLHCAASSVLSQPPEPKRQGNSQQGREHNTSQQGRGHRTSQQGRGHNTSQQRAQFIQDQPIGKPGGRPGLNLQPTAAQKATNSRSGQSLSSLRAQAELKAKIARGGGKQQEIDKSLPPPKPKATKVCRNCQTDTPLKDYFCEKRLPDGLMHMCMKCASKKGLSGKPATPEVIAAIMRERNTSASMPGGAQPSGGRSSLPAASHAPSRANGAGPGPSSTASQARGGPSHSSRGGPGAQQRRAAPTMQAAGTLKGFYGSAPRDAGPVARMVASGGHRRQREDLDRYEDDFVDEDEEEEDWRAQLRQVCCTLSAQGLSLRCPCVRLIVCASVLIWRICAWGVSACSQCVVEAAWHWGFCARCENEALGIVQVTGGWRRRRDDSGDEGDDRMMEASAADIRREEAHSKRLGRQEDIEADQEEAARVAAKAAAKKARAASKPKKRKKRRTGVNAFVNDEASEEDDEDSEEDYE